MIPCPTCQFVHSDADWKGWAEEDRAHAQHAHETADRLASRESSLSQSESVRRHAFEIADQGMAITMAQLHGKEGRHG